VAADLVSRVEVPGMPMMAERRRGPDAARLLGPHADWSAVQQALEQEYGGGRFLRTGSFSHTPELFAALDKNNDGRLRKDEFPLLNEIAPQVTLSVEFGSQVDTGEDAASSDRKRPRLKLLDCDAKSINAAENAVERPDRVSLTLLDTEFELFVNDTVIAADFAARAGQVLTMFDQNKNGYIETDELPESLAPQLARFEAIDTDEDGKVFPKEIEAYLAQQQAALRAQIHARVSDVEDAVFVALDADRDGRLTSRELEQSRGRLAALDHDQDGYVIPDEIPQALEIAIARGSVETPDATFARPGLAGSQKREDLPRWFTSMDANQDGVVSRREFIGSGEQFDRLDADQSGLIDALELQAVEKDATRANLQ
jgi:Ca2+-binding EF-hand superfamily protein